MSIRTRSRATRRTSSRRPLTSPRPAGRGSRPRPRPRRPGARTGRTGRRAPRAPSSQRKTQRGDHSGSRGPQRGHPLRRLVHHHPRVVHGAGHQQVGPAAGGRQVVVRRVGEHPVEVLLAARVAPLVPLVDGQRDRRVEHRGHHVDERHLGHDRPPSVRPLAEHRALEQPAGAQPAGGEPRPVDQPGEPVGDGDVVVERVLLVLEPPVQPPPPAALAAAADVRVHPDHAPVEQARQRGVPLRLVHGLVGAVPVEQRGRRPVERGVPVPDHGRRRPSVPSGAANVIRSVRYADGSWPGASWRCTSSRRARGEVDVGPDRRAGCRRGRRPSPPPRRTPCCGPGRPRRRGTGWRSTRPSPARSSCGDHPEPVLAARRAGSITTCPANASTRSSRSAGSSGRASVQAVWSWSASRGTGHRHQPELHRVVVGRPAAGGRRRPRGRARPGRQPPAGGRRPTAAADSGAWASTAQTSPVSRLSLRSRTTSPDRVARTFRSNRSSGSSSTSTSSAAGVPIRCRHTW